MRILLLGSGGREHAMAWKLTQSPLCEALFIAPGNAGTAMCGTNVSINILDFQKIGHFARDKRIDMLVVGPETPLVKGVVNYFANDEGLQHIMVAGPHAEGAKLEGSKVFAKAFMEKYHIPTAAYKTFSAQELDDGLAFLKQLNPPFVLKADGLAAGKGVVISNNSMEASEVLKDMLVGKRFGEASEKVVIEEFLSGVEMSVFVITDGKNYKMLPSAKDYKRVGDHDTGANTGGMGAVSPVPFAGIELMKRIENRIVIPTINGLKSENIPYCGFIFFGLMIVDEQPFVIEYNVRLGDPEAEAILPLLRSDLADLLEKCCTGRLSESIPEVDKQTSVTIVLCSGGYPGQYKTGYDIAGLDDHKKVKLFYGGVKKQNNRFITNGGRVVAITAIGNSLTDARSIALDAAKGVDFKGKYYRRDIGVDLLKYKPCKS